MSENLCLEKTLCFNADDASTPTEFRLLGETPLLDKVKLPNDLRQFDRALLKPLAEELRTETIKTVSGTGGHLGSALGVIELTVALHYVFQTPHDRLIWDVGHQAYPHKILTGRRDRIHTLRQGGGLSGFTKRSESEYDPFGTAHSSTSISAGLGMATARDLEGRTYSQNVICVIGDGAMSAGMAYEAMNNAGASDSRLIVILNDNDMSIAPPVGAMSTYLTRLWSGSGYQAFRDVMRKMTQHISVGTKKMARRVEEYTKGIAVGGTLFEEMGFQYYGPIDGHNMDELVPILENLRSLDKGPILLHVVTKKGKGYPPAEGAKDKYHGVVKFDPQTGVQKKSTSTIPSYTKVFSDALIAEARADEKIVAITAAMPDGTGLNQFEKQFPKRLFDVGIAEQHAVTFAAGMACEGYKPFVAIYSTFLQRGYDQIVHDVAIQSLPVRFMIDRAGLVGADGATHAGSFDVAYLACLPNMVVMAASDEVELMHMVATAATIDDKASAVRYPRGEGIGLDLPVRGTPLEIGKGRIVHQTASTYTIPKGTDKKDVAFLSFGTRLSEVLKATEELEQQGFSVTVADARFAKPLDEQLIRNLANTHNALITIEEGSKGGFGAYVLHFMSEDGLLETGVKVRTMTLPDIFQDQDTPATMYAQAGLDKTAIVDKVQGLLKRKT